MIGWRNRHKKAPPAIAAEKEILFIFEIFLAGRQTGISLLSAMRRSVLGQPEEKKEET